MEVYVVIGVYSGCIDYSKAWSGSQRAEEDLARIRADYEIEDGHDAESQHAAEMHTLILD